MREVICPYCNRQAELVGGAVVYPFLPGLFHKMFWICQPCDAYVGCHEGGDGTRPLGQPANLELRTARQAVHRVFDPLWHNQRAGQRKRAYTWLAEQLGISRKRCHIGMFDVETCKRAEAICTEQGGEFRVAASRGGN